MLKFLAKYPTDLDTKQKIKTYNIALQYYIAYSFLYEGCFCFPIFLCCPKHIKFDQNFVTKKPKQKITSFINSETTALLHLTSFTKAVTNIGFYMPIREIFSEFLIFWELFDEPLGQRNNTKIWETREIFANIVRVNVR